MTEGVLRRKWLLFCAAAILPLLAALLLLRFGNTQWNKNIYMFQAYVWPKYEDGMICPPDDYTGTWVGWHSNRQQWVEMEYRNGKKHGKYVDWYPNGQKSSSAMYVDGEFHGAYAEWHSNGQKAHQCRYDNGELIGVRTSWDEQGAITETGRAEPANPADREGAAADL